MLTYVPLEHPRRQLCQGALLRLLCDEDDMIALLNHVVQFDRPIRANCVGEVAVFLGNLAHFLTEFNDKTQKWHYGIAPLGLVHACVTGRHGLTPALGSCSWIPSAILRATSALAARKRTATMYS